MGPVCEGVMGLLLLHGQIAVLLCLPRVLPHYPGVGEGQGSGPVCLFGSSARGATINISYPDCCFVSLAYPYLKWYLHIHRFLNKFLLLRDVEMDKM